MILTAIDPGVCTGWASFYSGHLALCGVTSELRYLPGDIVIEKPQVYRATRSKGDPNDLIDLAILVGRYVERCNGDVTLVTPAEWKGQVPKHIHARRILDALTDGERRVATVESAKLSKSTHHNMIDAIGLGLWKLGRLTRGGAT